MQFSELIGQEVGLLLPKISTARIFRVKVLGVESGGIWISSPAAMSAYKLKKLQTVLVDHEIFCQEGIYSSLQSVTFLIIYYFRYLKGHGR